MQQDEYRRNYELEQNYWWFVGVRAMVDTLLELSLPGRSVGKAIDVGCGTGALLDQLKPRADRLIGVDISPDALHYCSLRNHEDLLLADATHISLPSGEFDTVTAIGVIEHLDDDEAFLKEMHRLLKPNGVFVMLTSSFPYLWTMHDTANYHKRRYYLRALERKLDAAGFETVRFSHLNFILFPILAAMLLFHRTFYGFGSTRDQRILPMPPRAVNSVLTWLLLLEAQLMRWFRLPWGISMIGAFRKRS
jgi:ubiquinone/menaquinone biosynthesis C-methylase UbiE